MPKWLNIQYSSYMLRDHLHAQMTLHTVRMLRDHLHAQMALHTIQMLRDHLHAQMALHTVHMLRYHLHTPNGSTHSTVHAERSPPYVPKWLNT